MTPSQRLRKIYTLQRTIADQRRRHGKRSDKQRELELLVAQQVRVESNPRRRNVSRRTILTRLMRRLTEMFGAKHQMRLAK